MSTVPQSSGQFLSLLSVLVVQRLQWVHLALLLPEYPCDQADPEYPSGRYIPADLLPPSLLSHRPEIPADLLPLSHP